MLSTTLHIDVWLEHEPLEGLRRLVEREVPEAVAEIIDILFQRIHHVLACLRREVDRLLPQRDPAKFAANVDLSRHRHTRARVHSRAGIVTAGG